MSRARALLAKAGVAGGFKVTIDMRTVQPVQGITEAIQQTMKLAGIELEILPGDGKQTLTKYRAPSHDICIGTWGADDRDPHTNADTFARNARDIPELTKQANAAALERDGPKRAKMYQDNQAEFRKTSPCV